MMMGKMIKYIGSISLGEKKKLMISAGLLIPLWLLNCISAVVGVLVAFWAVCP
jgi:hypothetical protein